MAKKVKIFTIALRQTLNSVHGPYTPAKMSCEEDLLLSTNISSIYTCSIHTIFKS